LVLAIAQAIFSPSSACGVILPLEASTMADYAKINDPVLQARVRSRYDQALGALLRLGFRRLEECLESLGPFSAVLQLPVLLLTLPKREVLVIRRPLRLGVANALLSHDDPAAIGLCMGMGVKLYSSFADGTLLITSTFQSHAVPVPTSSIVKPPPSPSIEGAWSSHQEAIRSLEAEGKSPNLRPSFESYVALSHLEEDLNQYR
jgi:hypothetical protein